MAIEITGINYFMPIFSFLFVFIIIYAILFKTKILGESKFINLINLLISFIMAIVFISFSSVELYVRNVIPWFVVLFIIVFLVLLIAGFSTKDLDKIMTNKFAWAVIVILIIIFLIVAIQVFNPVFNSDKIITSGDNNGISVVDFFVNSKYTGSILLVIAAVVVAWAISRK